MAFLVGWLGKAAWIYVFRDMVDFKDASWDWDRSEDRLGKKRMLLSKHQGRLAWLPPMAS